MKILITGGAGFVGSHLCEKFVGEGHKVVCLDNYLSGDLNNVRHLLDIRNFKLIKGDIRDTVLLEKIGYNVDAIIHLAAIVHVDRSYIEPRLTYDINVNGTQNILELARMYDIEKVIFASTSEVYGSAQYVPIDEDHPLNAPHPYGASKIAADRMCNAYIQTYGLNISIPRCFNIFGPRQKSIGYGGVISIFTRRVLNGFSPLIFGDGLQTRDYTYIDDVVTAYELLLQNNKKIQGPINFGTGKEITILDIANKIIKYSGNAQCSPIHEAPRIGEVKQLICDYTKAREIFSWIPKVPFDEGLKNYINWYRQYGSERREML
jgi:UDP-glucose 4-epimerase